jgi:hypothetical protein
MAQKKTNEVLSCFKELDVLSGQMEVFSAAVASLQGSTKSTYYFQCAYFSYRFYNFRLENEGLYSAKEYVC